MILNYSINILYQKHLFNKSSDNKLKKQLDDYDMLKDVNLHLQTAFTDDEGHAIPLNTMLNYNIEHLKDAFVEIAPQIYNQYYKIEDMIEEIQEKYKELDVMSRVRKDYYLEGMSLRFNELIFPRYVEICKERGMLPEADFIEEQTRTKNNRG